jgi:hypothetical protein
VAIKDDVDVAGEVGACAGTVDGVLRDFVDRGWIRLEGTSLVILDAEALAALRYPDTRRQDGRRQNDWL